MTVPAQEIAARRLVLSAAEFAVLVGACDMAAPAGFTLRNLTPEETTAVAAALIERGVLAQTDGDTYQPVESIAANLAVLIAPAVMMQVEVSAGGHGLRAVFAVSGSLGASLFTVRDGGVELSLFPAISLGMELIRAVPVAPKVSAVRSRVAAALGDESVECSRLSGRLPLAALESTSRYVGPTSTPISMTANQAALVEQINWQTTGLLSCVVTGRIGAELAVGQVVWLVAGGGWLGLRKDPDPDGARMVVVEPVDRADLGTWVAPYLAEILEARTR